MLKKIIIAILGFALLASVAISIYLWLEAQKYPKPAWSQTEKVSIVSLWIGNLPPLAEDPSNAVSDNIDAAKFGHQLFFDTRFSSNGKVACMTCHDPGKHFTDGRA